MPKTPVQREIVIRRGPAFWEWKTREQNESKWKNTQIPTYPKCEKPALCKWCIGLKDPMGNPMLFPFSDRTLGLEPIHVITPMQACHLVAFEQNNLAPGVPIRMGWVLTPEEIAAGKKGSEWPTDV